jgi:hypothetical protein
MLWLVVESSMDLCIPGSSRVATGTFTAHHIILQVFGSRNAPWTKIFCTEVVDEEIYYV